MKRKQTMFLVQGAVIAALYAALTYAAGLVNLAYGSVQFRFSEALTVLAVFTPSAIPGLAIGCFLGNLGSPFGMLDVVCGTLATVLAAGCSYMTRKIRLWNLPILSLFFPVLFNALIVGAEIAVFLPEGFTVQGYWLNALWVGLGELTVCYAGGIPLFLAVEKTPLAKRLAQ